VFPDALACTLGHDFGNVVFLQEIEDFLATA